MSVSDKFRTENIKDWSDNTLVDEAHELWQEL